jgi:hypothetical protein
MLATVPGVDERGDIGSPGRACVCIANHGLR